MRAQRKHAHRIREHEEHSFHEWGETSDANKDTRTHTKKNVKCEKNGNHTLPPYLRALLLRCLWACLSHGFTFYSSLVFLRSKLFSLR